MSRVCAYAGRQLGYIQYDTVGIYPHYRPLLLPCPALVVWPGLPARDYGKCEGYILAPANIELTPLDGNKKSQRVRNDPNV